MPAHVRPNNEAFPPHLLAERTQACNRIDAWVVPLLPLKMAHLQDERLGATHFHAVHYVRNFHTGRLNLSESDAALHWSLELV